MAEIERKQQYLKDLFRDKHIKYAYHDAKTGYLEAVLARGDRQLGKVILKAWKKGCTYDSWTEFFNYDKWIECFHECNIDPDLYANRPRNEFEQEPWDPISEKNGKWHKKVCLPMIAGICRVMAVLYAHCWM